MGIEDPELDVAEQQVSIIDLDEEGEELLEPGRRQVPETT
jgi:hypothetical protein